MSSELSTFDRAQRLGEALMFERINENTWRGVCKECHRQHVDVVAFDEHIVMQCMNCGLEYPWRKIEHDLFNIIFEPPPTSLDDIGRVLPLNDPDWWKGRSEQSDWLAEPLIPAGRSVALYAPAKAGKSMVVLALVTALALGRPVFGRHVPERAAHVLYLDFEMTEGDVLERLESMGFSASDLLGDRLTYVLQPALSPLDTMEGGQALLDLCLLLDVQLVIIDTFTRAIKGGENDSDTVREFYRCTGAPLKRAGIALCRSDHSGKNIDLGMRGSSSKNDDVDVVWQLTRTENGVAIKRTHSRLSWVPDEVLLSYVEGGDGDVSIEGTLQAVPAGTSDMMRRLDELGIDPSASARQAIVALRDAGRGGRTQVVNAAQRARRDRVLFGGKNPVDNDVVNRGKVLPRLVSGASGEMLPERGESLEDSPSSHTTESQRKQPGTVESSTQLPAGVTDKEHHLRDALNVIDDDVLY